MAAEPVVIVRVHRRHGDGLREAGDEDARQAVRVDVPQIATQAHAGVFGEERARAERRLDAHEVAACARTRRPLEVEHVGRAVEGARLGDDGRHAAGYDGLGTELLAGARAHREPICAVALERGARQGEAIDAAPRAEQRRVVLRRDERRAARRGQRDERATLGDAGVAAQWILQLERRRDGADGAVACALEEHDLTVRARTQHTVQRDELRGARDVDLLDLARKEEDECRRGSERHSSIRTQHASPRWAGWGTARWRAASAGRWSTCRGTRTRSSRCTRSRR